MIRAQTLNARAALLVGLAVAGCTPAQTTAISTDISKVQADLSAAINYYGIAKGIALVAEASAPALAPAIDGAISVLDPLVATAQQLSASAQPDAAQAEALVQTITQQAVALTATAAPAIKVVSNGAAVAVPVKK